MPRLSELGIYFPSNGGSCDVHQSGDLDTQEGPQQKGRCPRGVEMQQRQGLAPGVQPGPQTAQSPSYTTLGRKDPSCSCLSNSSTHQSNSPGSPVTEVSHRAAHLASQGLYQETKARMREPGGERASWPAFKSHDSSPQPQ